MKIVVLIKSGKLLAQRRWLVVVNRCVAPVTLKSWAKTMPQYRRRSVAVGEHRSTPRKLPYDKRASRHEKTAAIHEWLCLMNPASPEKFPP